MSTTTKPSSGISSGITSFKCTEADRRAITEIRRNLEHAWARKFSASAAIRHALRTHPMGRQTLVNSAG